MNFLNALRPSGPYVGENIPDIVIGEGSPKAGHATRKAVDATRGQRGFVAKI
ncbi:hypothetical protein [Ruegeria sp. SCSIO 43209]|uniref:hypothetical protein n=1 Tax=Ruegeria sp. SCSIO 43209 TaxID=2793010 RepID=UPI001CA991FD